MVLRPVVNLKTAKALALAVFWCSFYSLNFDINRIELLYLRGKGKFSSIILALALLRRLAFIQASVSPEFSGYFRRKASSCTFFQQLPTGSRSKKLTAPSIAIHAYLSADQSRTVQSDGSRRTDRNRIQEGNLVLDPPQRF